jgi:uncharacterized phage protein (TIGR01671 family)
MKRFAFRAWNNKKKEWQHKEPCDILGEMILLGGWMNHVSIRDLNEIVVMQFSGLRDKNGKEIYEGDIVRYVDNPTFIESSISEVIFDLGSFKLKDTKIHLHDIDSKWLTVLGNIFDNPELITNIDFNKQE